MVLHNYCVNIKKKLLFYKNHAVFVASLTEGAAAGVNLVNIVPAVLCTVEYAPVALVHGAFTNYHEGPQSGVLELFSYLSFFHIISCVF